MERLDERPRIRDDLTVVELDGEAVIYDEVSGDFHRLNQTATLVFSLLDGSVTLEELARDLSKAYSMKDEDVIAQVSELASQLAASHLLVGTEPGLFAEADGDDGT